MTARAAARVEFTLVLRWKTALHRPQKRVLFVAEYVYTNRWEFSSIRPSSPLP
jgi:hypothetical protein